MLSLSLALMSLFVGPLAHADRVRHVTMKRDQIVQVKTAIGVATIIQVQDNPTSLVVGDGEAFKVEFLEQAITIKPLLRNAKSNLYIYTEYRRFDVQLVTVPESTADYVVYLMSAKVKSMAPVGQTWKNVSLRLPARDFTLNVRRTSQTPASVFVEFELTSKNPVSIDPSWIWLVQGKSTLPIQRLVLSAFKVDMDAPVRGVIEVLKSDLKPSTAVTLQIRRNGTVSLTLPKVSKW